MIFCNLPDNPLFSKQHSHFKTSCGKLMQMSEMMSLLDSVWFSESVWLQKGTEKGIKMCLRQNTLSWVLWFMIAPSVYNSNKAVSPRCWFTPPSFKYGLSFICISFALLHTFITFPWDHSSSLLIVCSLSSSPLPSSLLPEVQHRPCHSLLHREWS